MKLLERSGSLIHLELRGGAPSGTVLRSLFQVPKLRFLSQLGAGETSISGRQTHLMHWRGEPDGLHSGAITSLGSSFLPVDAKLPTLHPL